MTKFLDQVDYSILHEYIEEVKKLYDKTIIGFVSDKQGAIRKCFESFNPEIPH